MEYSVSKIKLSVTNIKSFLIRSNKKLITLDKKKISLIRKGDENQKRLLLEKRIEKKPKIKIPLMGIGSVFKTAGNIFNSIVEAFSWLLFGFLITNLPKIIATLKKWWSKNIVPVWKGVMKAWNAISESTKKFVDFFRGINLSRVTSLLGKYDSDAKAIQKDVNALGKDISSIKIDEDIENNENTNILPIDKSNQKQSTQSEQIIPSKDKIKDQAKSVLNDVIEEDKPNINLINILKGDKKDKVKFNVSKKSNQDLNIVLTDDSLTTKMYIQPIIIDKDNSTTENINMLSSVPITNSVVVGSTRGLP